MWWICWRKCVKCLRQLVVSVTAEAQTDSDDVIFLRTVVCCGSRCLWPAADFHSDSLSPSWLLTCMMNVSLLLVQTHPSGICLQDRLNAGGVLLSCCLLSVIPHSLNKWKQNNVEIFLFLGFRRLSHNVNRNSMLAWPPSPHLTSGLNSEPNRPGSPVWSSRPPNCSCLFQKNFHLEKILHSNRGEKRREVPWSRPFSNLCSGKAIREQLSTQTSRRDEELEDEWQVSKLLFKGKQAIIKTFTGTYCVDSLCGRLELSPAAS